MDVPYKGVVTLFVAFADLRQQRTVTARPSRQAVQRWRKVDLAHWVTGSPTRVTTHTPLVWRTGWARYKVASHSPLWERTW